MRYDRKIEGNTNRDVRNTTVRANLETRSIKLILEVYHLSESGRVCLM